MKVIAISGYKGSGKDTAADYLVKEHKAVRVAFADNLKDMVAREYDIPRSYMDDPQLKEAPLLHLPVTPKDDFSLELSKMLCTEFRTESGVQALEPFIDASGTFLGSMGQYAEQLYWTPRSLVILKGSTNRAVTSDYWVSSTIDTIKSDLKEFSLAINEDLSKVEVQIQNKVYVVSDLRYRSEMDQLRDAFGSNLVTVRVERFNTVNSTDPSEKDLDKTPHDVVISNKTNIGDFLKEVKKLCT